MILKFSELEGDDGIYIGVEGYLVHYVKAYGNIVSLDQWAHLNGLNPWWVRECAHRAAEKKLIKLTRLNNAVGKPYQVSIFEGGNT